MKLFFHNFSGEEHHRRVLTNFYNLKELHLTNAFTEVVDSKYYLDDLMDIFLASEMKTLYRLHLEQNEIWTIRDDLFCSLPALSDLFLVIFYGTYYTLAARFHEKLKKKIRKGT
jgi:hypothetical protein